MSHENDITAKLQSFHQAASPQSKRNTKNLSLKLKPMASTPIAEPELIPSHSPTTNTAPFCKSTFTASSPTGVSLFRHPSLSSHQTEQTSQTASSSSGLMRRRTTLSLFIPPDSEKSSPKLSSNSIPSFSSSSPITSSPVVPSTPNDAGFTTNFSSKSSHSSHSTLQSLPANSNGDLQTQTLIQNLSYIGISNDGDSSKMNAYPEGPKLVMNDNLYLYSEPDFTQISHFDLIINVARELKPPFEIHQKLDSTHLTHLKHDNFNYYYVPWTHTAKICPDLPFLTDLINTNLQQGKKVLIHCQCGVSRSASLIVALIMKLRHLNLNDSYNILKNKAPDISPNMSLIFQLMEWGEMIGVNTATPSSDYAESPIKKFHDEDNKIKN